MKKNMPTTRIAEPRTLAPVISRLPNIGAQVDRECCTDGETGTITKGEDCSFFQVGKTPLKLQIDSLGFSNGACSNCSVYGGQFVLTQELQPCLWSLTTVETNCFLGGTQWKLYAQVSSDVFQTELTFAVWYADSLQNRVWEYQATVGYSPLSQSTLLNGDTLDMTATWVFGTGFCNGVSDAEVRIRGYRE